MDTQGNRFFSVKEARAVLGIGHTTIYKLMNSGALSAVKIGASTKISEAELARYRASLPTAKWRANHATKAA